MRIESRIDKVLTELPSCKEDGRSRRYLEALHQSNRGQRYTTIPFNQAIVTTQELIIEINYRI
jgi:hypothetical protein